MIRIDADKPNYINYYKQIMDLELLSAHGILVCDNCLWGGRVLRQEEDMDLNTRALNELNHFVSEDPRTECVLLPIDDGSLVVRRVK